MLERYRSFLLDGGHRLVCAHALCGYQEHGDNGSRPLHSRMTMNKDMMACLELPPQLELRFGGPRSHVGYLGRLQIIIHRNTIPPLYGIVEGEILGTIEDRGNAVGLEPFSVGGGFAISEPQAG